jgi:AGCS family alanine or glycine:cation symporter
MEGGPMYVIEHGMGKKWLAVLFALFTSLAAYGIGNMVQANSMASMVYDTFGVPVWITGAVSAILVAAVILGGVENIAKVCNVLVPFMALFYVIGCLIILAMGYQTIPLQ